MFPLQVHQRRGISGTQDLIIYSFIDLNARAGIAIRLVMTGSTSQLSIFGQGHIIEQFLPQCDPFYR
ncbi:hypothetical protein D3C86_2105000 [compost metagenome]